MLKLRWLALVFVVVFLATLIAGIPASLVTARVPSMPVGGAPLLLEDASGTIWQGSVPLRWRQLRGQLAWHVAFDGLSPGVAWELTGDIHATGWLGGGPSSPRIHIAEGQIPAPLVEHFSPFEAEGVLEIDGLKLAVSDHRLVEAAGELRYSGGRASWATGETRLPELVARIEPQPEGAVARVSDPEGALMMEASVRDNRAQVQVYRAWPALLGVSKGGNPSDVVFESSQPIWKQ